MKTRLSERVLRQWHRKLAIIVLLPALLIFGTGLLLQWKIFLPLLQPNLVEPSPAANLSSTELKLDQVLTSLKQIPEARVSNWNDISLIDVRPGQNNFRVRTKKYYEVQFNLSTGEILGHGPKYSALLVALHEGNYFGKGVKQFIYMPLSILFILLWATGLYLCLPRRKKVRT